MQIITSENPSILACHSLAEIYKVLKEKKLNHIFFIPL